VIELDPLPPQEDQKPPIAEPTAQAGQNPEPLARLRVIAAERYVFGSMSIRTRRSACRFIQVCPRAAGRVLIRSIAE
jgi:hypothetical protein